MNIIIVQRPGVLKRWLIYTIKHLRTEWVLQWSIDCSETDNKFSLHFISMNLLPFFPVYLQAKYRHTL